MLDHEIKHVKYDLDLSDRSLICMDVRKGTSNIVVGGANHELKVVDIKNGEATRKLYSKLYGHSEWVTCCLYLDDGRILSGGMDGRVCLWSNSEIKCVELGNGESRGIGYSATLSTVPMGYSVSDIKLIKKTEDQYIVGIADYEGKVKIWSIANTEKDKNFNRRLATNTLKKTIQHKILIELVEKCGPAVALQCVPVTPSDNSENNYFLATGYRQGTIIIWDLKNQRQHMIMSKVHEGPCQCIKFFNIYGTDTVKYNTETGEIIQNISEVFLISSARMSGTLKIFAIDGKRENDQPIRQKAVFIMEKIHNMGISGVEIYPKGKKIITTGIDGKINIISYPVIDVKKRKIISKPEILYQIDWHQNVVTSFDVTPDGLLLTGCVDGSIAVHYLGDKEEYGNERKEQFLVDVICNPSEIKDIVNGINVLKMITYKNNKNIKVNALVAAGEMGHLLIWECNEYIEKWNSLKSKFSEDLSISAKIKESINVTQRESLSTQ